jgi:hypothetical protein
MVVSNGAMKEEPMLICLTPQVRLEAEGLDAEHDDLLMRSTCRRCGQVIVRRTYRRADYGSLAALELAAVRAQVGPYAAAVLAHREQCRGRR